MPVVVNKSSDSGKQPGKAKGSRGKELSPAMIAAVIGVVLVLIGGVYFFLMRGPSPGPADSASVSAGDDYGQAAPAGQTPVSPSADGLPPVQNLPDNSNITKDNGGPVTVPGK